MTEIPRRSHSPKIEDSLPHAATEDRAIRPPGSPNTPDPLPRAETVNESTLSLDGTTDPPAVKVDPYLGKTIDGRYLVETVLGEGGMGVVYAGKHKVIGKKVAIKVLRGEMARNAEITERFLQEARAASSIGNPHIIDISDFGTLPDGSTYFVMEYLAGKSLTAAMAEAGAMSVPRLLRIAKQIASGLGAAHDAGIVHRDLKPDNVMLITRGTGEAGKDFVKILDFGIAKVGGEASRLTRAGSVFGTPHYMSPEQAAGTPVDLRTDVYALGIILYEMASGRVPFDADNFMGILTQHMYKQPVPILALVPAPEIPPALDAIILKSLTKKVEGRYPNMGALLADLEKLERGETPDALGEMMARSGGFNIPADYFRISAMPAPVPARPAGVPRRGRTSLAITIGVVATLGLTSAGVMLFRPGASKAQDVMATPSAAPLPSVPPKPAAEPSPVIATAPVPPPDLTQKHVVIAVDPQDAKVVREGTSINLNVGVDGKPPEGMVALDLSGSETVNLDLTAPGRKTTKVSIDGSQPNLRVRLEAVPAAPGKARPAKSEPPAPARKCDPLFDKDCDMWKQP
jgi:eukaryotic-like serine/threonine-protein kinase